MKLVVGLGNTGRKYEGTRHNIGFMVVAELLKRQPAAVVKKVFDGEAADVVLSGERLLLLQPHTLMNRSGRSVLAARDFYKIPNEDLLVVCDDFHLPLGKLRFRRSGSSGGQKGLADIIQRLGGEEAPRLRLGIGPVPDRWDPADFVLGKFSQDERRLVEETVVRAADAVEDWAAHGIQTCMNQYN